MRAEFIDTITAISPQLWQQLWNTSYPFIHHDFLRVLEHSGSTTGQTGWQPAHLLIWEGEQLIAAMPLFIKNHSYGEYVFDWAWADAYHRVGLEYYPKLVTSIPFTPATGPRIAIAEYASEKDVLSLIIKSVKNKAEELGASSWHCLFPEKLLQETLADQQIMTRMGCQFHWFNQSFNTFDDFLSTFNSRKRKSLKKERRTVIEQGISLEVYQGGELSAQQWDLFYQFYHQTYVKRSGRQGYLGPTFFHELAQAMPTQMITVLAKYRGDIVAAALNFRSENTLYGRYWGCREEFNMLHFEACYYQGIEYAIKTGIERFDPGAQGEHKIQRGFTPVKTWSNHWITESRFRPAIEKYLRQDSEATLQYINNAASYLPFKKSEQAPQK